ncbi:MAG TPA: hypothetical protein VM935_19055 [Chitinophagaceae bacterium]|jgi:hypothetical protein|nr:hypothetical protein [Chitinophagaceae bacterium]
MKKAVFFPLLFLSLLVVAQKTSKRQDIQILLSVLQVKTNMQKLVDDAVGIYKKQKPAVPQQVWSEIKNKVDYSSFMNKLAAIYDKGYSEQEIKQLIKSIKTLKSGQQPQLKPEVVEQSYIASNLFGKYFTTLLKEQIKAKRY